MTSSSPSSLQKKTIVRYFSGVVSGIILCILAFSLYNAHFPIWSIFLLMGIYSACITFLTIVFYQKKLAKTERNQEKQLSILRHDIKGILSSALLMADRILLNKSADEKTTQSAESIAQSIEKVADYLKKTKQ